MKAEVAELGKGARLRALFRRDTRVQIPSSALDMMFFGEQSLNSAFFVMGVSGFKEEDVERNGNKHTSTIRFYI